MKGFSRFLLRTSKSGPRGSRASAVVLVAASVAFVRCIPNPDTSGLPPYDAGLPSTLEDTGAAIADASFDVTLTPEDAATDAGAPDSGPPVGTITGIVIDYSQGNGRGVVPRAVVSLSAPTAATPPSLPAPVTTDANGLFTITNVPVGLALQVGTTKATDFVNGIAYSSTYLTTTVGAGQIVNVFPVLHEGCYQTWTLDPGTADAGNAPVTLDNATCAGPTVGSHPGAYAAMSFDAAAFKDPLTNLPWNGSIRVEMIPLAYPELANGSPDLSWSVGLPGVASPPGLLGGVQYRVVKSDPGQADDGQLLDLLNRTSDPVSIAVPLFTSPTAPQPLTYWYDTATGGWVASTALPGALTTSPGGVSYVMVPATQLAWWAVVNGTPATTCVTGTVQQAGAPAANVGVRAAGVSYLGTSTAVTSSTGSFCLDVGATAIDGGVAQIAIVPESVFGGIAYAGSQAFSITKAGSGSCAVPGTGTAGCTAIGAPIALAPTASCTSGNVVDAGSLATLDAVLQTPDVAYATTSGIQPSAYVGQVALGTNGAFCALSPPGVLQLRQAGAADCYASLSVLNGSSATVCSAGGCADAGSVSFDCHLPLP
jgi:hypothetical protein